MSSEDEEDRKLGFLTTSKRMWVQGGYTENIVICGVLGRTIS